MKKIIGILGVAVIAATMFFSANANSAIEDVSLASLIGMNSANAESDRECSGCISSANSKCTVYLSSTLWVYCTNSRWQ